MKRTPAQKQSDIFNMIIVDKGIRGIEAKEQLSEEDRAQLFDAWTELKIRLIDIAREENKP